MSGLPSERRTPWPVPWLFLAALLGLWGWNATQVHEADTAAYDRALILRQAQVDSCERNNELRELFNERGAAIADFIDDASAARVADAAEAEDEVGRDFQRETAARYAAAADRVRAPIEVPDCEEVVAPVEALQTTLVGDAP